MGKRNILYRIFDSDGDLLYVGATTDPGSRIAQHAMSQPWWDEAAEIKLEHHSSLENLLSAEHAAITVEGPRYNITHLQPSRSAMKPRRPRGGGSFYQRPDGYWVGAIELPPQSGVYKRRRKRVVSRDRATALRKFEELKAQVSCDG